jgi:chaperonin GroES
MTNDSGITPTGAMVLVKYDAVETKSTGGIILPSSMVDRNAKACQEGTLVAAGEAAGVFSDGAKDFPAVGKRVIVKKYAEQYEMDGTDGCTYRLCEDKDILAVLGD